MLLVLAASTLPVCAYAGPITATEWRAAQRDEQTRLVVELSDTVSFSISGSAQPLRLTVQLPSVSAHLGDAPQAIGVIGSVKAEASGGGTALVIKLAEPALVAKAFVMTPSEGKPYRLVIDLAPCSRAQFAKAFVHEEKPEPVKVETVKAEAAKPEPVKPEPLKSDTPPVKQAAETVPAAMPVRIAPPPAIAPAAAPPPPPPEPMPPLSFPASPAPTPN